MRLYDSGFHFLQIQNCKVMIFATVLQPDAVPLGIIKSL